MNKENAELVNKFFSLIEKARPDSSPGGQDSPAKTNWEAHIPGIITSIQQKRPRLWNGDCLNDKQYPSHSEADFALTGLIAREAMGMGISRDDLEATAQDVFRRSGLFRPKKWQTVVNHTIPKIIQRELEKEPLPTPEPRQGISPTLAKRKRLFADLELSEDHVVNMNDAEFIVPNLIVRSHVAAIVAPANSGKTALFVHFAKQIAQAGYDLYYINCDASPPDLKRHFEHAKKYNYQLIAPDAIPGKSPNDVIVELRDNLEVLNDLSKIVIILDTLKKFVDIIDKPRSKLLYSLIRALTVRGCTFILLGHTNKHPGRDGQMVYEGTGDLRNDVDEMIYLDAEKDEAKSALRVTTRPDKVRADIKPRSFLIHLPDRTVEELDRPLRILRGHEAEILELAIEGIWLGNKSQKDLVAFILDRATSGVGEKKVKTVIARHAHEGIRITVQRAGRAKDLVFGLTPDERALKVAQEEADRNSPF
jgi:KaiC/GvpD/RAD55 family RecA-like ATPase